PWRASVQPTGHRGQARPRSYVPLVGPLSPPAVPILAEDVGGATFFAAPEARLVGDGELFVAARSPSGDSMIGRPPRGG
ncbi:hypothetical protein QA942_27300, partial [Streptomyces sp. B21-106]